MRARLVIDLRSREPSYLQLATQLRDMIISGQIGPGEKLPPISEIVSETGLAVGTIRHAVAVLVEDGFAHYPLRGRGTYAVEHPPAGNHI